MKGKDVIRYIQDRHLEDASVTVTATMYRNGDHDCITTEKVSISESSRYVRIETDKRPKYVSEPTIDFYVDSNLY